MWDFPKQLHLEMVERVLYGCSCPEVTIAGKVYRILFDNDVNAQLQYKTMKASDIYASCS